MTSRPEAMSIGGYFELELPRGGALFHQDTIAFNTGRACLSAILQHKKPVRVHAPFYICDAALMPMREAGIPVRFYELDKNLEPLNLPDLDAHELILVVNFFGLQTKLIETLADRYGDSLIADCTQAFFEKPKSAYWAFSSARKFFGVPDGANLYAPEPIVIHPPPNFKTDIRHLVNRLVGRRQTGYAQVRRHEQRMDCRIRSMSKLTERLLSGIDYEEVRSRRRANYQMLNTLLSRINLFDARLPTRATPLAYPLLLKHPVDRTVVAREQLFIPTFWPDIPARQERGFAFERHLVECLLPLPVDQRYTPSHMAEAVRRLEKALGPL